MDLLLSTLMLFGTIEETVIVARMPQPTPEIRKLVDDMGDHSFIVRERATAALHKKGYEALRALELNQDHKDPEVAHRARRVLIDYYSPRMPKNTNMPGILRIPQEGTTLKWKGGKYVMPGDMRKELYMASWYDAHPGDFSNPQYEAEVSVDAMLKLVKKLLRLGVPKAAIEEWLSGLANAGDDWQPSDFEYES